MTTTTPKPAPTPVEEQAALPAADTAPSGGKAPARKAVTAQEDRLAAALRANLARRKAASRAARQGARDGGQQTERSSGDDDAEA